MEQQQYVLAFLIDFKMLKLSCETLTGTYGWVVWPLGMKEQAGYTNVDQ